LFFSNNGADGVHAKAKNDDKLTLLADFGKTEAICVEVLDNPTTEEEGILLKVMARGPFEQGQQVWIVGRDGSKVGATVEKRLQANHRQRSHAVDGVAGINGTAGARICLAPKARTPHFQPGATPQKKSVSKNKR